MDFYCPKAKLVIELDGGQHKSFGVINKDTQRDNNLTKLGLTVLRFNNNVTENIEGVLVRILSKLDQTNPP